MDEKFDIADIAMAELNFGFVKPWPDKHPDLVYTIAFADFTDEDKQGVGIGLTKMEALDGAFKNAFPELKEVKYSPQIAMSPALANNEWDDTKATTATEGDIIEGPR